MYRVAALLFSHELRFLKREQRYLWECRHGVRYLEDIETMAHADNQQFRKFCRFLGDERL